MRRLILYILFLGVIGHSTAQDKSLFDQATTHYADRDYQAAIKDYKQLLDQEKTSTALYFNLANAYYKSDQLAQSIYYYNKALQLSPQDEDVKTNLLFARQRTVDEIEKTPKTGWAKFIEDLTSLFDYNSWAVLAIICSTGVMVFGIAYYFTVVTWRKRLFFTLAGLALLLAVLSVSLAYHEYHTQKSKTFAIVFDQKVEVHAEPNTNSSHAFTLHEGTKVKVLDDFNGFTKIQLADGKQGWLVQDAVRKL